MKRTKLEDYILTNYGDETKVSSLREFAEAVDYHVGTVRKWINGSRTPRNPTQIMIEKLTKGRISLYDW